MNGLLDLEIKKLMSWILLRFKISESSCALERELMSPKVLASKPFLVTLKYACKPYLSYHAIFDDFFISYNQLQFSVLSKILFECV